MSSSARPHRRALGTAALVTAVAATALVPIASATADSTQVDFTGGLTASGWTGPAATGSDYDFEVVDADTLRASNWTASNSRGVITQLLSPTTDSAGEPFYTDADGDTFGIDFTLDSALEGEGRYDAQPGLALELSADQAGNRAGGGITLRVPEDGVLELSNYFSLPSDLGSTWRNAVAEVPFTGALDISYDVRFVANGPDEVTVSVDGVPVLSGGTYEGYTAAASGHAGVVDGILLRAVSRGPGASPAPASWTNIALSSEQNAALQGNGLLFSALSYGADESPESGTFPSTSTTVVQRTMIQGFEDSNPASATYNYDHWHVVRGDDDSPGTGVVAVTGGSLILKDAIRNGRSVQLVKGFASGELPTDLHALVDQGIAWDQPATSGGAAHFQLPVFRFDGSAWVFSGTLYPAAPTVGFNTVQLGDAWKATRSFNGYTAHTAAPLGDIIDALGEEYVVSGFGIASSGADATTAVSALYFGGVKYVFANDSALVIAPVVSGEAKVGKVLTVSTTTNFPGVKLRYQWFRGATTIPGATAATYKLVAADRGIAVTAKVTASKAGFAPVTRASAKTAKVAAGTLSASGVPTLAGDLRVGATLIATPPTFSPGAFRTYQWYRGTTAIPGATLPAYTLAAGDRGKSVSVRVTGTRSGYTTLAVASTATATIGSGVLEVTAKPTISGMAKAGQVLTAKSNGWNTAGVVKKYAWYSDTELIQLSTSPTLLLTWEHRGSHITVKVTGTKLGYVKADTLTSAPVGSVL